MAIKTTVVEGDISKVKANALITAINSGGMWYGGIDGVIQRAAGTLFHDQALKAMPLKNGDTVVATSKGQSHKGAFADVIFVVDDLVSELRYVVYNGLVAADEAGYKIVTLPTIRMGVMLGAVEATAQEAINEMVEGIKSFLRDFPQPKLESITFVVYNDPTTKQMLEKTLKERLPND